MTTINNIIDKHAPLRKANKKELKLQQKPWITPGIIRSIKERDKIFRKIKNTTSPITKANLQKKHRTYRNLIVTLVRLNKKNHTSDYFANNIKNIRKTWEGIRKIVSLKENSNFVPNCLLFDGTNITHPKKIANRFNKFFSSVGKQIQNQVYSNHINFSTFLKDPSENSLFLTPTDTEEVSCIISSFKSNIATGPNSIPITILKKIQEYISAPLASLINCSFENGICPNTLKTAKIIPIHKKGSRLSVDNYRPISLLSNINKIFEKIMYKRLYRFLSDQSSFFELQFGFREKHSTTHALISLTEKIRESLDKAKYACGIFIDLKKAFDTVDHTILLKKLEYYGVRGISNEWFRSYLNGRRQFVSINGFESESIGTDIGVPQGSVLGPLLFLIYINDLHHAIKNSIVHHFADDTNLLHINDSLKKLNKLLNADLKSLCNWLKANKIALNVAKTELVVFKHPNKNIPYNNIKLKIDGKKIIPSSSVKYLGVIIDEHLTFKNHINELAAKLRRSIGMLSKLRHYVPLSINQNIYYAVFDSLMKYACPIWGQKGNPICDKIITYQNIAMRVMTFSQIRSSSKPLYRQLKVLTFRQQIELQNCLIVHSQLDNSIPNPLKNMFTLKNGIHAHNTRNPFCLAQHNVRTTRFGLNSIKSQCIQTWNRFVNLKVICNKPWPFSKRHITNNLKEYFFTT